MAHNQLVEKETKRKKVTRMPLVVRATTTTNARSRRQRMVLPPPHKSNELDVDYLQALKVIDRNRRQEEPISVATKMNVHGIDQVKERKPKQPYQLSSTLTSIGQEAMMKTYEDTLISHLTNVYSSKRIGAVLPRLHTAKFRLRLPVINKNTQIQLDNIHQAQILIDNILNNNRAKDEMLGDYVKWQQQWTKKC